jgi:hypothetical protein
VRHATVSRPIAAEQRQTKVAGCGLVTSQLRDVELGNCSFNLGGYVAGCTADRGKGDSSLAGMDEWHIEEKVSVSKFFAAKILICRVLPLDQQKKKLHLNSLQWIGISQKHGERPAKTLYSEPHPVRTSSSRVGKPSKILVIRVSHGDFSANSCLRRPLEDFCFAFFISFCFICRAIHLCVLPISTNTTKCFQEHLPRHFSALTSEDTASSCRCKGSKFDPKITR